MALSPHMAVTFAWLLCLSGCVSRTENSSVSQPNRAVVMTDPLGGSKVTLSQKQATWFVADISRPGVRSNISSYPAAPLAKFEYAGKAYLMHGNAVIHVQDDGQEFLWTGPYLQALVSKGSNIRESIDRVEELSDLNNIEMDAPGAYPGGGPAPLIDQNKQ